MRATALQRVGRGTPIGELVAVVVVERKQGEVAPVVAVVVRRRAAVVHEELDRLRGRGLRLAERGGFQPRQGDDLRLAERGGLQPGQGGDAGRIVPPPARHAGAGGRPVLRRVGGPVVQRRGEGVHLGAARAVQRARVGRGVDGEDLLAHECRGLVLPALLVHPPQDAELLHRLGRLPVGEELVGQEAADHGVGGRKVGELLQRLERGGQLPGPPHPLGVLQEVLARIGQEARAGADLAQPQVDGGAPRDQAQHLAAERDGVVEEPGVGVPGRRALVRPHGAVRLPQLEVEVADAVPEGDVGLVAPHLLQELAVQHDGLGPLVAVLGEAGLGFQLCRGSHVRGAGVPTICPAAGEDFPAI